MVSVPVYALIAVLAGAIWVVWRLSTPDVEPGERGSAARDDVKLVD